MRSTCVPQDRAKRSGRQTQGADRCCTASHPGWCHQGSHVLVSFGAVTVCHRRRRAKPSMRPMPGSHLALWKRRAGLADKPLATCGLHTFAPPWCCEEPLPNPASPARCAASTRATTRTQLARRREYQPRKAHTPMRPMTTNSKMAICERDQRGRCSTALGGEQKLRWHGRGAHGVAEVTAVMRGLQRAAVDLEAHRRCCRVRPVCRPSRVPVVRRVRPAWASYN